MQIESASKRVESGDIWKLHLCTSLLYSETGYGLHVKVIYLFSQKWGKIQFTRIFVPS